MARIRTIKPEFWASEQVVECSPIARLLFVGLWNFCDDGGVHPASVKRLKMEVFPGDAFTDDQLQEWVNELLAAGLIMEFEHEGQRYWKVTGWAHQKIDRPNLKYPQEGGESSPTTRQPLADKSPNARRTLDEQSPPEGKGREGRVREYTPSDKSSGVGGVAPTGAVPEEVSEGESPPPKPEPTPKRSPTIESQVREAVEYLNLVAGKKFDPAGSQGKFARARLKAGASVEQLCLVVDHRVSLWAKDDKMRAYLRPETLWCQQHWEDYLPEAVDWDGKGRPEPVAKNGRRKESVADAAVRLGLVQGGSPPGPPGDVIDAEFVALGGGA